MATKAEIKRHITPRIAAKMPPLTGAQYLEMLKELSPSERNRLVDAWNSGSITKSGRAVQRLRKAKLRELAESEADKILVNDSIDLDEWEKIK